MGSRDVDRFARVEPRLAYLRDELERLLRFVELEHDGRPVRVDGFRLKSVAPWQTYRVGNALRAVTGVPSADCVDACPVCAGESGLDDEEARAALREATVRLKHYDPATGRALFPPNPVHRETLRGPEALEIVEAARRREPGTLFSLTTCGRHVTDEIARRLAELRPLIVTLLVEARQAETEAELVERRMGVALGAATLLERHRVVFIATIVLCPSDRENEIEALVQEFEQRRAYAVRLVLPPPRYRRPSVREDTGVDPEWAAVVKGAERIAQRATVAVLVAPDIYRDRNHAETEVAAVILNSPAHRARLRPGDIVRAINGRPVRAPMNSEMLLDQLHLAGKRADLLVRRGTRQWRVRLEDPPAAEDTYPYDPDYFVRGESYGIVHADDVRLRFLHALFAVIRRHGARTVLLFTPSLFAPILDAVVRHVGEVAAELRGVQIQVESLRDDGTPAASSQAAVVAQCARIVRHRVDRGSRPDLILIPHTGRWGRDATGRSCMELAMEFGIPVERIDDLSRSDHDV